MFNLPPIPSWDGLHPLIIHFPIGLLFLAPVFLLLGLMLDKYRKSLYMSAFIIMLLGTVSAFIAVSTGEAAGEMAIRTPDITKVIMSHEELAEKTVTYFSIITAVFLVIFIIPIIIKKELNALINKLLGTLFFIAFLIGLVILISTAHNGGRLVHELGVRALM
ncbi:MAG: hypothetical protein QG635_41 [Bacteroidota bacterium]|nr:hypothetical protein [Bacteroidota bacterium]